MAKKQHDLPATVYVHREEDTNDGDTYLMVGENYQGMDGGTIVGVYELKGVSRVAVGVTLEEV